MDTYLFKFSACLLVFWLVYVLVLERQKMHHFKRFYLLTAIISAIIIPLLTIIYYVEPVVSNFEITPLFIPIETEIVEQPQQSIIKLETILWLIYSIGVLLFSIRFLVNLVKMYRRISSNEKISQRPFIYVLLQQSSIPHTFFKYIFFNKLKFEANDIPKEVILHEETHAKQLHSIDIIAIELLQIVFWFHPLIYILKHHIKLNHEFLADQTVLENGVDTKTYQNILLQFSSPDSYQDTNEYQLSSAINYSSIKKRFTVMKTQTSKTRIWLSSLLLLPIIAILFYSFSTKEYIEKEPIETSEVLQIKNEILNEGASEKLMQEYRDFITTYKETNTLHFDKYERAIIIYDELMSDKQRASVEKSPEQRENSLLKIRSFLENHNQMRISKVESKKPTSAQFESWKNKKEFAIWIDGNNVINSELNNYSVNDIVYFSESKVYKNARTAKFPQPFQSSLYTKEGFRKTYEEADIEKYRKHTKLYSREIKSYLQGSQTDNSELRILKVSADKLYNQFAKNELEKYNILPAPPVPTQKEENLQTVLNNSIKNINQKQQNPKTITVLINRKNDFLINNKRGSLESLETLLKKLPQTETYNLDFRTDKVNGTSEAVIAKTLLLLKKYNVLKTANATEWNKVKEILNQQKATAKQVAEYNTLAKKYNAQPKDKRVVKLKDIKRLEYIYKLMSEDQKKNAESFPECPPPPPVPPLAPALKNQSFFEYIIDMDKKGALFYLDGKKITATEAKTIAKNNKGKNTEMLTQKDKNGNYVVKLSSPKENKEQKNILPIVNGKIIKSPKLSMRRSEFKSLELKTINGKITGFRLKIPGKPTQLIKGNSITKETIQNLNSIKTDFTIIIFDIKDIKDSDVSHIEIEITD